MSAEPIARKTKYAIRMKDGRFLTAATFQGAEVWIWLDTPLPETTFPTMTAAYLTIWGTASGADLGCTDPWTVIPVIDQGVRP